MAVDWSRRICDTLCWPGGFFAIVVGFVDWDDVSFEAWIVIMSFGFAIGFLFYLSTEDGPKEPYSLLNDHGGMDDDLIEKGGPAKSEDAGAAGSDGCVERDGSNKICPTIYLCFNRTITNHRIK